MFTIHQKPVSFAVFLLTAGAYAPFADADQIAELGTLPSSTSVTINNAILTPGSSFIDIWNFKVADSAAVVDSQNSVAFIGVDNYAAFSSGVGLTSVALFEGGTQLSLANLAVSATPVPPLGAANSYNASLNYASLQAGHQYSLEIR